MKHLHITIAAMSIRAKCMERLEGLDMIIVDYIQLMRGTLTIKMEGVQEVSEITQGLKAIDKELSIPRCCSFTIIKTKLSKEIIKKPQF